jgi:hypothetical protein
MKIMRKNNLALILIVIILIAGCIGTQDSTTKEEKPPEVGYKEPENLQYTTFLNEFVTFEYPDYVPIENEFSLIVFEMSDTMVTSIIGGESTRQKTTPEAYISLRIERSEIFEGTEILGSSITNNEGYIKIKEYKTHIEEYNFYYFEYTKIIMCNEKPFKLQMDWDGDDLEFPTHIMESFKCI